MVTDANENETRYGVGNFPSAAIPLLPGENIAPSTINRGRMVKGLIGYCARREH